MVKSSLRLPRHPMRDATHTTLLQRTYYKKLVGLYKRFETNLQPTMTRLLTRSNEPGIMDAFRDRVNAQANGTIMLGAPEIIRDNITQAYIRGKKTASANPRLKINSIIIPFQLNMLDQKVLQDLKARNLSNVTKLTEDMKTELMRVMSDGIRLQQSTESIIRAINTRIPEITRSRAKMIARTEISYSYNNAQAKAYQSVGLDRWQWLAALGYACCPECIARHGNVYTWGDEQPPLHPCCLCTLYPVVDEEFKK